MSYNLMQICQKSFFEKRNLKIIRVDKQETTEKDSFWFSAFENNETNIFSPKDLNSYWLILEEGPVRKDLL